MAGANVESAEWGHRPPGWDAKTQCSTSLDERATIYREGAVARRGGLPGLPGGRTASEEAKPAGGYRRAGAG